MTANLRGCLQCFGSEDCDLSGVPSLRCVRVLIRHTQLGDAKTQGRWRTVQNCFSDDAARCPCERQATSRHFIENQAKREDVGSGVQDFATHLLRRHVCHCAYHDTRHCEFDFRWSTSSIGRYRELIEQLWIQFGQAEVQNFGVTTLSNENIRRFNVAVHNFTIPS